MCVSLRPLAAIATWLALAACHPQASALEKTPTPVRVREGQLQPAAQSAGRFSGTVETFTRVDLAFKVAGYVRMLGQGTGPGGAKHTLQEGDFVSKGTVLAVVRSWEPPSASWRSSGSSA